MPQTAGGLLLGGAFANVADRLPDGLVTDLIRVGPSPVFNLADVAIVLGFMLFTASAAGSHDEAVGQRGDGSQ